jgi:hypothetical protein
MIDDKKLLRLLKQRHASSLEYHETISQIRAKNIDYYLRRPDGHEEEGRSTATVGAVSETVNSIHAQIADLFSANEKTVVFESKEENGSQISTDANDVFDYVFNAQNDGALITDTALKDGLLVKAGHAKVFWEKKKTVKPKKYRGLSFLEYQSLALNPSFSATKQPDETVLAAAQAGVGTIDIDGIETKETAKVCIVNVPSEELLISADACSPYFDSVPYCCHRTVKTIGDLTEMGLDVSELNEGDALDHLSEAPERAARRFDGEEHDNDEQALEQKNVRLFEEYIIHDCDEDGADEITKIYRVKDKILLREMVSDIPFASWCPIPIPHEFYGECPADEAVEFQDRETEVLRSTYDGMHLQNMPRLIASQNGEVNLDDLMTVVPGSLVRARDMNSVAGSVRPLIDNPNFRLGENIQLLEITKAEREQRTGVTRHNQGLDGATLSKTATGQRMMLSQSQLKVKMMARNFADMFMRRVAHLVMSELEANQHDPLMIVSSGSPRNIHPSTWRSDMQMKCAVSLGTGTRDEKVQSIGQIAAAQEKLLTAGATMMVTPANLFETAKQVSAVAQLGSHDKYFTDPAKAPTPPPPPPPLEMQLLTAQLQHDAQKTQAQLMAEQQKNAEKLALEREKIKTGADVDLYKTNVSAQIDAARYGLDEAKVLDDLEGKKLERAVSNGERQSLVEARNTETSKLAETLKAVLYGQSEIMRLIAAPKQIVRDENGRAQGVRIANLEE